MAVYAKGRKSLAISDRSGFRVPYKNLRTEWNGLRVSPDDYDPKHPQLTPPKNITDATAPLNPFGNLFILSFSSPYKSFALRAVK